MERPNRPRPARAGFTLIELLVAILIIATLLAILLPAVNGAYKRAKEAQVSSEINNLATALASFKNQFGDYPPSRVLLSEIGYAELTDPTKPIYSQLVANLPDQSSTGIADTDPSQIRDLTVGQLAVRSLSYMRKFWPRADFMTNPSSRPVPPRPGEYNDFNGNRNIDESFYILEGSECLAFFLGGIPIRSGTDILGMSGFSKSPRFPFVDGGISDGANLAPNRTVPNFEFANGRLVDPDGNGMPSYIDPFDVSPGGRRAYVYFSAYGANSYDPNDCNGYRMSVATDKAAWEFEDNDRTPVERGFSVAFPVGSIPGPAISPAPNPYTAAVPVTTNPAWINANSFQLFAAGQDRQYGLGGTYKQGSTGATGVLPILPGGTGPNEDAGNIHSDNTTGVRNRESDNLTNFSAGRLQ